MTMTMPLAQQISYQAPGAGSVQTDVQSKLREFVSVKDFGAVGDGVTDDTVAIQAAIDSLTNGGVVFIPSGAYITTAELSINVPGVTIQGQGCGDKLFSTTGAASRIRSSALTGSVIRAKAINTRIIGVSIEATTERQNAARDTSAAGYNAGLRFEGADAANSTDRVVGSLVDNVKVSGQPNDGIIFVAGCFQSAVRDSYVYLNGGSGVVVDAGLRTGRTNLSAPGPITLENVVSHFNEGSGFVFGNPSDDATAVVPSLRIVAINCESLSNNVNTTGGITYEAASWYVRGDNIAMLQCAATCSNKVGTPNHHIGIALAGRVQKYFGFRFLSVSRPIKIINYAGVTNSGIDFDQFQIRSITSAQVCELSAPTVGVSLVTDDIIDMPSITNFVTTTAIDGLRIKRRGSETSQNQSRNLDYASTGNIVLADDAATSVEFSASGTFGIVLISGPTTSARPSLVAFRVGSSNYVSVLAGIMNGTTGVLTGTTGPDANVSISTDAGNNRLYIENRSGSSRTFRLTFFSMQNGVLLVS
jgi:hypothetical protein